MSVYVLTGARQNVGAGIARKLASDSQSTVITLNRAPLEGALAKLGNVHDVRMDQTDLGSIRRAVEEVKQISGGKVDVLICVAASNQLDDAPLGEGKEEVLGEMLTRAFQTNTVGTIQLISLVLPLLRAGSKKRILVLTSAHAVADQVRKSNLQGRLAYGSTKAATDLSMIRIANQLKPEGFTTVSISPSIVTDKETATARGLQDFEGFVQRMSSIPGSSGVFTPDQGAEIILGTFDKMGVEDSGRVVGMWGSEDKWI